MTYNHPFSILFISLAYLVENEKNRFYMNWVILIALILLCCTIPVLFTQNAQKQTDALRRRLVFIKLGEKNEKRN